MMFTEKEFNECLDAAAVLDGSSIVAYGGMAGVYIGTSIGSEKWLAKADWSNNYSTLTWGGNPSEALANLTNKLKDMRSSLE